MEDFLQSFFYKNVSFSLILHEKSISLCLFGKKKIKKRVNAIRIDRDDLLKSSKMDCDANYQRHESKEASNPKSS